jgi:hypothetical protein
MYFGAILFVYLVNRRTFREKYFGQYFLKIKIYEQKVNCSEKLEKYISNN